MAKYEERKLETEKALSIVGKLLEVFKYCVEANPIIITSYPCCYNKELNEEREKQAFCTVIHVNDRVNNVKYKRVRKESEEDLFNKYNTYYIHYKTHNYRIKFFDSPITCGHGEDQSYNEETDMFCIIESVNFKNESVYEMHFTFNILNMEFIELYSLSRIYRQKIYINAYTEETGTIIEKSMSARDSEYLNRHLKNRKLIDFSKLINRNRFLQQVSSN